MKDSVDVVGFPTRHGSAATPEFPAATDDELVRRVLRHASVTTTTDTYGHLTVDDLRDAVACIGPKNPMPFAAGLLPKPPRALPAPKDPQDFQSDNRAFQSEPRGDRTHDPRLKRPVLYQLS